MELVIVFVASYLLGAIPSAYIIGKIKGIDITSEGSGNIGGTNAYRVLGAKLGVLVALMDVLKVILPLWLTKVFVAGDVALALAALGAVTGHNWSVYVGFRGGKGIAVSIGTYVFLFPVYGLIALGFAIFNVLVTRYVSLGSLNFVAVMAVLLWVSDQPMAFKVLSLVLLAMAFYRHRSNIVRLRQGEERRFGQK